MGYSSFHERLSEQDENLPLVQRIITGFVPG
jgi:hypothetical protein